MTTRTIQQTVEMLVVLKGPEGALKWSEEQILYARRHRDQDAERYWQAVATVIGILHIT